MTWTPPRDFDHHASPAGKARVAALVFALALHTGCEHRASQVVAVTGVFWNRVTPVQVAGADFPDWRGDSIAFQVPVNGLDRIAIAAEDGGGIQIEPEIGAAQDRSPRWVAGGLLVYSSDLSGSEDLWYRELDTGATRRLTALAESEWTPVPRPMSPGLVYVEGADPAAGRLVLIPDTAASPLDRIHLTPSTLMAGEPDWNSTGDQLCFTVKQPDGSSQIWRVSMSDTLAIQLTVSPSVTPPMGPQIDRSPRWSPDGTTILMASNRGGLSGVWTLSPLGEAQGLKVIAQDRAGAEIRHPVWSPDGKKILLSTDRSGYRALWALSNLEP